MWFHRVALRGPSRLTVVRAPSSWVQAGSPNGGCTDWNRQRRSRTRMPDRKPAPQLPPS